MASPENPYDTPGDANSFGRPQTASTWKRTLVGFLIGASTPFAAGFYTIIRSQIHAEIDTSGGFVSGAIPLRALLLIFIISPVAGIIGAVVARFYAKRSRAETKQ